MKGLRTAVSQLSRGSRPSTCSWHACSWGARPASVGVPSHTCRYARCGHNSLDTCAKLSTVSCLFYLSHSAISTGMKKLGLAWKLIFSIACCMFTERHIWVLAEEGTVNSSLNMAVAFSTSYWWWPRPSLKMKLQNITTEKKNKMESESDTLFMFLIRLDQVFQVTERYYLQSDV